MKLSETEFEEFAFKAVEKLLHSTNFIGTHKDFFVAGAKWAKEVFNIKEDVLTVLDNRHWEEPK